MGEGLLPFIIHGDFILPVISYIVLQQTGLPHVFSTHLLLWQPTIKLCEAVK